MKKFWMSCVVMVLALNLSTLRAAGDKHEETELGSQMDEMRDAFKKLRGGAGDVSKLEENLAAVAKLLKAAEASVHLVPAKAAELPEAERAKFVADYQAAMKKTVETIKALEAALKAKDVVAAAKLVGEIGGLSKEGHKAYKKPDNH